MGLTNLDILSLAIDPVNTSVLYAGTAGGGVFKLSSISTVYLPIIIKSPSGTGSSCTPSAPGESNNIADALTVCSGQTVSGQVANPTDFDDVYKILVTANQQLTISMNGTGGDADLFLYPPGTADVNTDVGDAGAVGVLEEDHVAGLDLVATNRATVAELGGTGASERDPVPAHHVLYQAGTVKTAGALATAHVGLA